MNTAYTYKARGAGGAIERGLITSDSEAAAYALLISRGLEPIQIRAKHRVSVRKAGRINDSDLTAFARELSISLEAGVPLAESLGTIAETEENEALRVAIQGVSHAVCSGVPLGQALRSRSAEFGELFVEMMVAAEQTGDLSKVTSDLADLLERRSEIRKGVRRAMAYPTVVLTFILVALSVITFFVIPRFAEIFESNGVALPVLTRVLRAVGVSVTANWLAYGISTIVGGVFVVLLLRTDFGKGTLRGVLRRLPYFGKLTRIAAIARFCRVLSVAIGAGLDVIGSIQIAAVACGEMQLQNELLSVSRRMRSGSDLRSALREETSLPSFATRLLCAGQDAREVGRSSTLLAKHFDRETDGMTKNISTVVEPLMTVGMAVIVLVVALSVFIPMWSMIKVGQ
ncbi:MAG: type II secretory pathway component PulF [Phycisphaerales bacterium]|jgi:type II secretory pathway component PulF